MTIGILLITHDGIGNALLNVVSKSFNTLPINIKCLSVDYNPDPDLLIARAGYLVNYLERGDGVLVLTDMFGSTPSNIAQGLQQQGYSVRVIAGLNLPMLFKILNYPHLSIDEIADNAVNGGTDGIFEPVPEIIPIPIGCNKSLSGNLAEIID